MFSRSLSADFLLELSEHAKNSINEMMILLTFLEFTDAQCLRTRVLLAREEEEEITWGHMCHMPELTLPLLLSLF